MVIEYLEDLSEAKLTGGEHGQHMVAAQVTGHRSINYQSLALIHSYKSLVALKCQIYQLQSKPSYPIPLRRTKKLWVLRAYGWAESAYFLHWVSSAVVTLMSMCRVLYCSVRV